MRYGNPDLVGNLGANLVHLKRRQQADYRVGDPGAHGRYRVTFRGFGFRQAIEAPAYPLDGFIGLELPEPVVGYAQRLQLAGPEEIADAGFVENVLGEFDGHCVSTLSVAAIAPPLFYKTAMSL